MVFPTIDVKVDQNTTLFIQPVISGGGGLDLDIGNLIPAGPNTYSGVTNSRPKTNWRAAT